MLKTKKDMKFRLNLLKQRAHLFISLLKKRHFSKHYKLFSITKIMFGKLKEKLKNWFTKSKEEIEKKAEKIEEPTKKEEIKVKEKPKKAKKEKKALKIKEEKLEPEEAIKEIEETKTAIEIKELENKIEAVEQEIEKIKEEKIPEVPLKFETGKQKYEPDLEKIQEELEETKGKQDSKEVIKEIEASKDIGALGKEEKVEEKSFFRRLKSRFSYKISEDDFNNIFENLEMLLLENNVALEVVEDMKKKLSRKLIGNEIKKEDLESEIKRELKSTLDEILIEPDDPLDAVKSKKQSEHKPFVILFFGINGTGKTTSIAKIASLLQKNNLSVVLAAADTFRAASIEQIQVHADKLKIPLIKHDYGADPSAVGFDAIKYAEKHKIDVVLIDTAGRMHTKTNLLTEMDKICRVTKPDLKIFVAESIAGNDAVEQAKTFHEMIDIDGSILSKADIDEKGGTIISVSHATHKPIFYLGVGQGMDDLKLFNKQEFIEDLGL